MDNPYSNDPGYTPPPADTGVFSSGMLVNDFGSVSNVAVLQRRKQEGKHVKTQESVPFSGVQVRLLRGKETLADAVLTNEEAEQLLDSLREVLDRVNVAAQP